MPVNGIDASPPMVERMRAKPGGADIAVSIGDFADVRAPGGPYGLIYVVFNTFLMLRTQETYPIDLRYAWPSEIDLMARLLAIAPSGRTSVSSSPARVGSAPFRHDLIRLMPCIPHARTRGAVSPVHGPARSIQAIGGVRE